MSWRCALFGHRWRSQSVMQRSVYRTEDSKIPVLHKTDVLLRCERCPEFTTKTINGHWTLMQLLLGEEMHDSPQPKVRT